MLNQSAANATLSSLARSQLISIFTPKISTAAQTFGGAGQY